MMPPWHRTVRLVGAVAISIGLLGLVLAFPFVAGDPESFATSDEPDPGWVGPVAGACLTLSLVGLTLVLLPIAHRTLRRR